MLSMEKKYVHNAHFRINGDTDGLDTWQGDVTIDWQSESQNGYPVDIKDLEADKNKMMRRFDPICRTYVESHCERQEVVESM